MVTKIKDVLPNCRTNYEKTTDGQQLKKGSFKGSILYLYSDICLTYSAKRYFSKTITQRIIIFNYGIGVHLWFTLDSHKIDN